MQWIYIYIYNMSYVFEIEIKCDSGSFKLIDPYPFYGPQLEPIEEQVVKFPPSWICLVHGKVPGKCLVPSGKQPHNYGKSTIF